jgi:hypothetical protein
VICSTQMNQQHHSSNKTPLRMILIACRLNDSNVGDLDNSHWEIQFIEYLHGNWEFFMMILLVQQTIQISFRFILLHCCVKETTSTQKINHLYVCIQ